jgi:hypothetical protein
MCSIYCDSDDVDFRELSFNGSEMLWKKYWSQGLMAF